MNNKLFKDLIDQYFDFEKLYPKIQQIQRERRGVLYKVIHILERDLVKADEICKYFQIEDCSKIDDDLGIAYDNVGAFYIDSISKFIAGIVENLPDSWSKKFPKIEKPLFILISKTQGDKKQMEIIVVTAFILISGFALVKWKSSTANQLLEKLPQKRHPIVPKPIPTAICLAVPSSAVYGLTVGKVIDRDKIIQIVDSASYFLCSKREDADKISIDIDASQEPSPDSQLKFYIRIDIPDGNNILGVQTIPILKGYIRELPPNTQGKIKELGRLGSVYSLKSFNRI